MKWESVEANALGESTAIASISALIGATPNCVSAATSMPDA